VDFVHPKSGYAEAVRRRLAELAGAGNDAAGIVLDDVEPTMEGDVLRWRLVTLDVNRAERMARLTIQGPAAADATIPDDPASLGAQWYALRVWRELRRAILELRFNYPEIGLVTFHTEGDAAAVRALDEALERRRDHWFVRETLLQQARTLKMIDVTARTFFPSATTRSCSAR
jgi:benzoyl-CoA-dihydrodiol lyase